MFFPKYEVIFIIHAPLNPNWLMPVTDGASNMWVFTVIPNEIVEIVSFSTKPSVFDFILLSLI